MIFISAQPDSIYFIWQLELQLRNFNSLNIDKKNIHVLIAFNPAIGLNPKFKSFIESHKNYAKFYFYPDMRVKQQYMSSIRPHILKQHFEKYPELRNETLFYHDSDILFSRIPRIYSYDGCNDCYVSDTRNYLDIDYIRRLGSTELLNKMAEVVGIEVEIIERNKHNTGGAQYVLNNIDSTFWNKVEADSEQLFTLMLNYNIDFWEQNYPSQKQYRNKKNGIQAWCADMWAVLWNLWLCNKNVLIHSELDFSWPYSPIAEWNEKAIQHYSGNITEKSMYFKKHEYFNHSPWYDTSLLSIPNSNCSYKIVELIIARKEELDMERLFYFDSCIIFDGREYTQEQLSIFSTIKNYIQKN